MTLHNFISPKCSNLHKAESKGTLEVTAAIHLLRGWLSYPQLWTIGVRDRPCTSRLSTSITNLLVSNTKKSFTMTLITKHYQDSSIVSCALCVCSPLLECRYFRFQRWRCLFKYVNICLQSSLLFFGLIST